MKIVVIRIVATVVSVFSCLSMRALAQEVESPPTTTGVATVTTEKPEKKTELILHLGNESNPVDGVFGPLTYGLRGSHTFQNDWNFELGYVRLHEPKTNLSLSVVDEAQVTVRAPRFNSIFVSATAWKNRLVDIYTNLGGLEVTDQLGAVSISGGAYAGDASREDIVEPFRGIQLAAGGTIATVEVNLSGLFGKIGDQGSYRKLALENSVDVSIFRNVQTTLSLGIEERYFNFGHSQGQIDPPDEFIFTTGLEFHFEDLIF